MPFWCILAPQWTNSTKWKSKFSHSIPFLILNKSCSEGFLFIINFQFWNCIPKKFQIFRNLGKIGKNLGIFFGANFPENWILLCKWTISSNIYFIRFFVYVVKILILLLWLNYKIGLGTKSPQPIFFVSTILETLDPID